MVYQGSFYRIVLGGTIYAETWNTSLSHVPGFVSKPVDEGILGTIAAATQTFFQGNVTTGVGFSSLWKLTYVKVNRINAAGLYQDPESMTHIYPTPVQGGASATNPPPQIATVATLRTAQDRGRASRGRMYLPGADGFATSLGADGRALPAAAVRVANAVTTYINNLNAAFAQWGGGASPGWIAVNSNIGTGTFNKVTAVQVGRTPDTMRSRRSSLPEDYQSATVTIA